MECWAKTVGGCDGPITREHILSRALLPKEILIQGLPWCAEEPRPIGRDSFTSKNLCRAHNNGLSPVDAEAVRLRDYLFQITFRGAKAKGQRSVNPFLTLSGTLFARWLCKTHCNLQASAGKDLNPDFVRYAFARRPEGELQFYSIVHVGRIYRHRDHPPSMKDYWSEDGSKIVVTNFYGWTWIVTNFLLSDDGRLVLKEAGIDVPIDHLMNRVRAISVKRKKPRFNPPLRAKLELDWTEEFDDNT